MIELCFEYFSWQCIWLYVIIMSCMRFIAQSSVPNGAVLGIGSAEFSILIKDAAVSKFSLLQQA